MIAPILTRTLILTLMLVALGVIVITTPLRLFRRLSTPAFRSMT